MLTVNDAHGAKPQTLETYVATVSSSEGRRDVWAAIYRGRSKTKTVSEIASELGLTRKAVLTHGLYLAEHSVVTQEKAVPRGGTVPETAYTKTSFGKANRDKILREASKPKAARSRSASSPAVAGTAVRNPSPKPTRQKQLRRSVRKSLLFATATPPSQHPLRLEAEMRKVGEHIRRSNFRDRIGIVPSPAADAHSLIQGINDHRPTIVHFSGHAGKDSLWLDDGEITDSVGSALPFSTFAKIMGTTDTPPALVVLNACHSANASAALLEAGIPAVIGMSESISDEAAAAFSSKFYAAIASDQSLEMAFRQACVALEASGLVDEAHIPTLSVQTTVNPSKVWLLR